MANAASQPVALVEQQQGVFTEEIISKMSVNQLKEELRK
jgi:hypothetical protein